MVRATLMVAWGLAMCGVATGAPVGIELTATITGVDDPDGLLGDGLHVGDTVTAKYVYDSATPDTGSIYQSRYEHDAGPYGVVVRAGGMVFQTDPAHVAFSVGITDSNNSQGGDAYLFYSESNLPLAGEQEVDVIRWQLAEQTGTAISSAALLPPVLSDWKASVINNLEFGCIVNADPLGKYFVVWATVTSATVANDPYDPLLPEPGTVGLVVLGLAGLVGRRRNKDRCQWPVASQETAERAGLGRASPTKETLEWFARH